MKSLRLLLLFLCLLFALSPTAAQETEDVTWIIEKRSIPDPINPPEEWAFDGTILAHCTYGICGLRSDWQTRRVLNFTMAVKGRLDLYQGTLSPDRRWYAAARGEYWCNGSCTASWRDIYSIVVFDISGDNPRNSYSVNWSLGYPKMIYDFDAPPLVWLDNEQLIYPRGGDARSPDTVTQVLNPFTEETIEWIGDSNNCIRCSPDRTRNLQYIEDENHYALIDLTTQKTLLKYEPSTHQLLPAWVDSWSPNSEYFVAISYTSDKLADFKLYNRDGAIVTSFLRMDVPSLDYPTHGFDFIWSPDNQHFWMSVATASDSYHYLVDIPEQQITELNIYNGYVSGLYAGGWSPDGQYLALWDYQHPDYRNVIVDTLTLQAYRLDTHDGYVFGWRED